MPPEPDPKLQAAAKAKKQRTARRTPDVICPKCDDIFRTQAALREHAIEKHPTGLFGPVKQEDYIALLIEGTPRHTAARSIGVHPNTVARFIELNPEFKRAVQTAEEEAAERVESALYTAAVAGEPWAAKEWLSKRNAKRWGPIPQEINVNHGGQVVHELGASPQMQKIAELQAKLQARAESHGLPPVIDAEVIEDDV